MGEKIETRRLGTGVWLLVVVLLVEALAMRSLLQQRTNLLAKSASWQVMKELVVYHPSAYRDFLQTPIASDGVNLWLGQGYEGLLWDRPPGVEVETVVLNARLGHAGSYLYSLFRAGEEGTYALLLSTHSTYASGFYSFADDWQTLRFEPLEKTPDLEPGAALRIGLELSGSSAKATVNGEAVGTFEDARLVSGTVGFKGGFLPSFVRSVEVGGVDRVAGSQFSWRDEFRYGDASGWWKLAALLIAFGLAIGWSLRLLLRPTAVNLSLLLVAGLMIACGAWLSTVIGLFIVAPVVTVAGAAALTARTVRLSRPPAFSDRVVAGSGVGVALVLLAGLVTGGLQAPSGVNRGNELASRGLSPDKATPTGQPRSAGHRFGVGSPIEFTQAPFGDGSIQAEVTVAPDSLLELRFRSPSYKESPIFECAGRWQALVLSTDAAIASGFYSFGESVELIGRRYAPLDRLRNGDQSVTIRIDLDGERISAFVDGELAASAAGTDAIGMAGFYLFQGAATVDQVKVEPVDEATEASDGGRRRGPWQLALGLAGLVAVFGAIVYRGSAALRQLLIIDAVALGASLTLLSVCSVLANEQVLSATETRLLVWSAFGSQILSLLVGWWPASRRGQLVAVATVGMVGLGSLAWTLLDDWTNSFEVVQLEMNAPIPPTPYSLLWYRHPSFRACNQFVNWQRFAGRRVVPTRPAGTSRVVTIGASQTLGFGASRLDRAYPAELERQLHQRLGDYEVINAGIPGSYTVTGRSFYQGVLADYRPQIVVINYCAADYLYYSLLALEGMDPREMIREIEEEGHDPGLIAVLSDRLQSWYGFRGFRQGRQSDPEWAAREYERSLTRLVESVISSGAQPYIVLEPKTAEVDNPVIDYPRFYEVARRVARKTRATVIDPTRAMRRAERGGILWWDYAHLTDFGQRVLASEVARVVIREARTPSSPDLEVGG